MIKSNRQPLPISKQPFSSQCAFQGSKNKSQPTRKPSLPVKRATSVTSNHSCMSDRIVYTPNSHRKGLTNKQISNNNGEGGLRRHNVSQNSYVSNMSVNSGSSLQKQQSYFERSVQKQDGNMNNKKTVKQNSKDQNINAVDKNLKVKKNPHLSHHMNYSLNNNSHIVSNIDTKNRNDHFLTGFQWLIVMRHCYHVQNKKRGTNSIKLRTLINFLKNKMYPDSVWSKILVMPHEKKIFTSDITHRLERDLRNKFNLDDIFCFLAKGYSDQNPEGQESAAETARFMDHLKANPDHHHSHSLHLSHNVPIPQHDSQFPSLGAKITNDGKKGEQFGKAKILQSEISRQMKIIAPLDNYSRVTDQMGLIISPISAVDQTNNNISFSMDDSSQQSQFSQSGPNKIDRYYYESTKVDENTGRSQIDRFESALHELESLKQKLKRSKFSEQKSALVCFMDELTGYSLYSVKKGRNETNRSGLGSKKVSLSSLSNLSCSIDQSHFYGIKLEGNERTESISSQILNRIFASSEFRDYFQVFQAIKIINTPKNLPLYYPYIGNNLRILNLSHNHLRSVSFIKQVNTDNLQFINLNHNKITNIGDLLSVAKVTQLHLKNNAIDHVSSQKVQSFEQQNHNYSLKLIDLSWNQIQKEEDLWALRSLKKLSIINLLGNRIMTNFQSMGLVAPQAILEYAQVYVQKGQNRFFQPTHNTKMWLLKLKIIHRVLKKSAFEISTYISLSYFYKSLFLL